MNDQVDRYRLIKRIGKGGMAEVFLASADGPHGFSKQVAIKKILPQHSKNNADFEKRFIREAKIAVELAHANIVQVLDFGGTQGTLYIVMEFVAGCDLQTLLATRRKHTAGGSSALPLPCAAQIAIELCNGLSFAHKHGVVHRDISPANILLSGDGAVKIADFGIAKAMDSFKTDAGLIVGKWRYMSPEQAKGETLDKRSDLFSLGIVLFEILTGRVLFDGKNTEDIVRQISGMPTPEVPAQFAQIIDRCLCRHPAGRYQDAKEIIADLRAICLQEQWLPSSDDVAKAVGAQAKSKFEKTKPLFAIHEPNTKGMERGVAAQMRQLCVEEEIPSRVTELDYTDADGAEETSITVLLKPQHNKSGLPTWTAETVEHGSTGTPPAGHAAHEEYPSVQASPGNIQEAPPPPANRRPVLLVIAAIGLALLGFAYLAFGFGQKAETTTASLRDAGTRLIQDSGLLLVTKATPVSDARPAKSAISDASRATDARAVEAHAKKKKRLGGPSAKKTPLNSIAIWVDPWADVYFRGRKIGRAPKKNFRLPHGRHKLRLVNPSLGVEKTVTITVPASKPYRFRLVR